jgi:hypothetical protein
MQTKNLNVRPSSPVFAQFMFAEIDPLNNVIFATKKSVTLNIVFLRQLFVFFQQLFVSNLKVINKLRDNWNQKRNSKPHPTVFVTTQE